MTIKKSLKELSSMLNDDLGEYWEALSELSYCRCAMSVEFLAAYKKEIEGIKETIKEDFSIKKVKQEKTYTEEYEDLLSYDMGDDVSEGEDIELIEE